MSKVTERYLGLGSFTIDLIDGLPADVRRELDIGVEDPTSKGFALVVVTPQRVEPSDYPAPVDASTTPHPLLDAARWTGVLIDTGTRRSFLKGTGLCGLLSHKDGVGHMHLELADKRVKTTASTIVDRLIDGGTLPDTLAGVGDVTFEVSPLRVGTVHAGGGTVSIGDTLLTTREWLHAVSRRAGRRSFHVRPTGHVDWGTRDELWSIFPRVMVGRLPASDDPKWVTVRTAFEWDESIDEFADQAVGDPEGAGGARSTAAPLSPYVNPLRVEFLQRRTVVEVEEGESVGDWQARAGDAITEAGSNQSVISSDEMVGIISPTTALEPGEPIYLYDPEAGLVDATNHETYAGEEIHPVARYLEAVTWPIVRGMGVYLLYVDRSFGNAQRIRDLTEYVKFADSAEARLEVGAPAPTL